MSREPGFWKPESGTRNNGSQVSLFFGSHVRSKAGYCISHCHSERPTGCSEKKKNQQIPSGNVTENVAFVVQPLDQTFEAFPAYQHFWVQKMASLDIKKGPPDSLPTKKKNKKNKNNLKVKLPSSLICRLSSAAHVL